MHRGQAGPGFMCGGNSPGRRKGRLPYSQEGAGLQVVSVGDDFLLVDRARAELHTPRGQGRRCRELHGEPGSPVRQGQASIHRGQALWGQARPGVCPAAFHLIPPSDRLTLCQPPAYPELSHSESRGDPQLIQSKQPEMLSGQTGGQVLPPSQGSHPSQIILSVRLSESLCPPWYPHWKRAFLKGDRTNVFVCSGCHS